MKWAASALACYVQVQGYAEGSATYSQTSDALGDTTTQWYTFI